MTDQGKELIFEEAREFLRKGIKELTSVVGVTLGPNGRYIGLDGSWGGPQITNDGNSIVKDIELKDQYENMGASIGKEVATKMKEECGDGTTTSLLLLGSLVDRGVKAIASGSSPIFVKKGMEKAEAALIDYLEKSATSVHKESDIKEIATSSSSGSREVGEKIAEAFARVGREGVITIEESKTTQTTIEIVEGMQFDRGYVSPYFCTNTEKMCCEMANPAVLVTDKKIQSAQEILTLLQSIASSGQELLIIADDIEKDALSTLVVNRLRGSLKVCAIKAPGFGDRRKSMLEDIAVLTGAAFISEDRGMSLNQVEPIALGRAEKVVITKDKTTIVNGQGAKEEISNRIKQIESEISHTKSSYDKEKLEERKAKLLGGVALIRVGAATEAELKQKKQLFEDSLNSTKAAIAEGVVVGGGIALLRAAKEVEKTLKLTDDEAIGAHIVFHACEEPFRTLIKNSGHDASLFLEEVLGKKEAFGFNVQTDKVEDLFKAGVRDPLKIVKSCLKYALSAGGTILLSECLIGDAPEEELDK